ncbi:MAG: glycosyltransferase family 4 protein [Chitinophagaceae bacterium]
MTYHLQILKRKIEGVLLFPFIVLGAGLSYLKPLKEDFEIFFFFPFYHTGGVEKYNLAIAAACKNKKAIIFFTRKSTDKTFYNDFIQTGHRLIDIAAFTDNKWLYFLNFIYRGIIMGYIHRQPKAPIVFNGQSNFGYKMAPWIRREIKQYECIHTFSSFSFIRQPFISFYTKAFSPSHKTIDDQLDYYAKTSVPSVEAEKFSYLLTGITLPAAPAKQAEGLSRVLFVGRGSAEKRVELVAAIAKKTRDTGAPIEFVFAGEVNNFISDDLLPYCTVKGNIANPIELNQLYASSQVLILTSAFEGFPLVVMEAMSHGLTIISTAVGDIPAHVKEQENGFLANVSMPITELIEYFSERLLFLHAHPAELSLIGKNNYAYAQTHFSITALSEKLKPYLNL